MYMEICPDISLKVRNPVNTSRHRNILFFPKTQLFILISNYRAVSWFPAQGEMKMSSFDQMLKCNVSNLLLYYSMNFIQTMPYAE